MRRSMLKREGFRVVRIAARDVLNDLNAVLRYIVAICLSVGPLHQPTARPPSPFRGGMKI
jgi:very-short-patch-repair endonuclease